MIRKNSDTNSNFDDTTCKCLLSLLIFHLNTTWQYNQTRSITCHWLTILKGTWLFEKRAPKVWNTLLDDSVMPLSLSLNPAYIAASAEFPFFFLHEVWLLFMFYNFTIFNLLTKNGIIVQTTVLTGHLKTVLLVLSQWEEAPVQKYSMQCCHDRETPYVSSLLNLFQPKTANLLGQFYFCVSVS